MPNWCTNILYVRGEKDDLEEFMSAIKNPVEFWRKEREKTKQEMKELSPLEKLRAITEVNAYRAPDELWYGLLSALFPPPKGATYEYEGKYYPEQEWCIDYWGTKWDIEDYTVTENDDGYCIMFDTAWAPPLNWLRVVSALFSRLVFELVFEEPGMEIKGSALASGGNLTELYE